MEAIRSRAGCWLGLVAALLTAGCVSLEPAPATEPVLPEIQLARYFPHFEVSGRILVRGDGKSESGAFRWTRDAAGQEIALSSPLGQTVAVLSAKPGGGATLATGSETRQGASIEALTQEVLGAALPIEALAAWVQGRASATATDASDKPASKLKHDDWEVAIGGYQRLDAAWVAQRITATRDGTTLRVVIDAFKALP